MEELIKAYVTEIAFKVIDSLFKKSFNKLTGEPKAYEVELGKIIGQAVDEYRINVQSILTNKTVFYESQILVEQLIKYQFGVTIESIELINAIENDNRIELPSDEEIKDFLDIFNRLIGESNKLKNLYIENNWKETTFRIASQIDKIEQKLDVIVNQTRNTINQLQISQILIIEWTKEIEIIKQLLYKFKPNTALELIDQLQKRIEIQGVDDHTLKSQLLFLKANAIEDINNFEVTEDSALIYLKAYRLNPQNSDYKRHAALSYLVLNELNKAETIADEIINLDEFDFIGWTIKLHISQDPSEFLKYVPNIVLIKKEFRLNTFFVFLKSIDTARIIHQSNSPVSMEVNFDEPAIINYSNFRFWTLFSQYVFSKIYYEYPMLSLYALSEELKHSEIYKYYFNLLKRLIETIKDSEVKDQFAGIRFMYHYAKLILTGETNNVYILADIYPNIKRKTHVPVMQMVQAYNLLNDNKFVEKSIKIIDEFGKNEHEILALFRVSLLSNLNRQEEGIAEYEKFVLKLEKITSIHLTNLLQFFKIFYNNKSEHAISFLNKLLERQTFPTAELKLLLVIYVYSIHQPDKIVEDYETSMDTIESELEEKYPEIREFYIIVLISLKQYDRIINLLEPQVTFDKVNSDIIIYCEALYHSKGNKIKLLRVLKKARQSLTPYRKLLRMEISLRLAQHDWEEVLKLSELALSVSPHQPEFIELFFDACTHQVAIDKIKDNKSLVHDILLNERQHLIIYRAFMLAKLYIEAAEILYCSANNSSHIQSRQEYISGIAHIPDNVFQSYEKAIIGSYVTYLINDKLETILIDQLAIDTTTVNLFKDRKVGEEFTYYNSFMLKTIKVKVLKITDKYGALFDEIVKQASNPLSGLKFHEFKFDGTSVEDINASLKKELGTIGSADQHLLKKRYAQYQRGEITFTEIVKSNYRNNPFDAYYLLTSGEPGFFQTIPFNFPHNSLNPDTKFVLDFTSICLLFEITKKFQINLGGKQFIISNYIKNKLNELYEETLSEGKEKFSVTITSEVVIPHFYPDDFQEKRLQRLDEVIDWVNTHCVTNSVDEKLDLVLNDVKRNNDDDYFHHMIDNKLLSERANYIHVTSDLFYIKIFGNTQKVISPEIFLILNYTDLEISDYLIENNYVGVQISKDILVNEFSSFIVGKNNRYFTAIENLKLNRNNSNPKVLHEGCIFLKWIYSQAIISNHTRYRTAEYLIRSMLEGLNERGIKILLGMINKQLLLLPFAQTEVIEILDKLLK